jgi:hypothetical protein
MPLVRLEDPFERARELPIAADVVRQFTALMLEGHPFSFAKFGDGELSFIGKVPVPNVDGQRYSPELAAALHDAFTFLCEHPRGYIAKWEGPYAEVRDLLVSVWQYRPTYAHYNTLLLRAGALTPELLAFYCAVRDDRRKKVFVGPAKLEGVAELLRTNARIVVPPQNAYDEVDRVERELLNHARSGPIVALFSAGITSKTLIHLVLQHFPETTCLDLGSAFDPAFVGQTRSGQPTPEEARAFVEALR